MRIEAPSDNVTEIKARDLPAWLLNYHMEAWIRSISKAQVPLDAAIRTAENEITRPPLTPVSQSH
jgi:hypothetical protein